MPGIIRSRMGRNLPCVTSGKTSPHASQTDVLGLQTFLWDKFARLAGNGSSVEKIRKNFKKIVFESIELLFHIKFRGGGTPTQSLNTTTGK